MTSSTQQLAGRKILFATVSGDKYIHPLTGLAKYLQHAGCDVRWYASKCYTQLFHQLMIYNYPLKRANDINSRNINDMLPERKNISNEAARMNFDMLHYFILPATKYYEDIRDIRDIFPFDMVITDCMFSAGPIVRNKLHIPVLTFGATSAGKEIRATNIIHKWLSAVQLTLASFIADKILFNKPFRVYRDICSRYGIQQKGNNFSDSIALHADRVLQADDPLMVNAGYVAELLKI
ncbi:glycosyltransferase family 1 protein [Chitinophaga pinensis]|uniref:Glycosyltransferase family 1 protein n=1 Tax=Chitinophaga pinensis TaxID=79329 RepID=A0A5C6LU37_9BACT|nr:glycosyltransferase family 1 protein [Chitinophaga pinensis]TWV98975.1 glycosyltransferase family 1 protein [Chitinophaga pinensis]